MSRRCRRACPSRTCSGRRAFRHLADDRRGLITACRDRRVHLHLPLVNSVRRDRCPWQSARRVLDETRDGMGTLIVEIDDTTVGDPVWAFARPEAACSRASGTHVRSLWQPFRSRRRRTRRSAWICTMAACRPRTSTLPPAPAVTADFVYPWPLSLPGGGRGRSHVAISLQATPTIRTPPRSYPPARVDLKRTCGRSPVRAESSTPRTSSLPRTSSAVSAFLPFTGLTS